MPERRTQVTLPGSDEEVGALYWSKVQQLADLLPKSPREEIAGVARALGISTSALRYRHRNPSTIKAEQMLALDALLNRAKGISGLDRQIAELRQAVDGAHREAFGQTLEGRIVTSNSRRRAPVKVAV